MRHEPKDPDDGPLDLDFAAVEGGDEVEDDCKPLDDDQEQVGYELFDWDPDELDELDERLHELDLPHEWVSDGYEVVVHAEDEETVDALLPKVRFPDELPVEADVGDGDARVLSDLFVVCDRLTSKPTGEAVNGFLDVAERLGADPPYGVEEQVWDDVVERVDAILDLFHTAGPPELIAESAAGLRDRLRSFV